MCASLFLSLIFVIFSIYYFLYRYFLFCEVLLYFFFFFFFQAEDGIRGWSVTGVQTCALPILRRRPVRGLLQRVEEITLGLFGEDVVVHEPGLFSLLMGLAQDVGDSLVGRGEAHRLGQLAELAHRRSEERRVGKECRSRLAAVL